MWNDLVCPVDQGRLQRFDTQLCCRECGRSYPVLESVPTFLSDDESPAWRRTQRQWIGELPRGPREQRVSISPELRERGRALERLISEHVGLDNRSRVLQVGPGGEGEIHHLQRGVRYAVDPLAGVLAERRLLRWGQVRWVAARGEQLPFADGCFSAVVLADVLDWVQSPRRVLHEAWRCLASDGVLYVSQRAASRAGMRHLNLSSVQELAAGFRVIGAGRCAALAVPSENGGAVAGTIVARDERYLLLTRSMSTLRLLRAA